MTHLDDFDAHDLDAALAEVCTRLVQRVEVDKVDWAAHADKRAVVETREGAESSSATAAAAAAPQTFPLCLP